MQSTPQQYVSPKVFEKQKLASLTGPINVQRLAEKARILFDAVGRFPESSRLCLTDTEVVIATLAHKAALYAYLTAASDYGMYKLYAQIHERFANASSTDDEKRDHLYRAVWGYAHYAQRFQDRTGHWIAPWDKLAKILDEAKKVAGDPDHAGALTTYLEIAKAGPPVEPLNLEDLLKAIGGRGETFRGVFMTELNRFLDTKGKEFPPDQHLTFAPIGLAGGDGRIFMTRLSIKDAADAHHEYPISIRVTHLSGFHAESSEEVGTPVVSIRDHKTGPVLFSE